MEIEIKVLNAWQDNYIFVIVNYSLNEAIVIDPTDGEVVDKFLQTEELSLIQILNTHHHPDHISGNQALKDKYNCPNFCSIYDKQRIDNDRAVQIGDKIKIWNLEIDVMDVRGHTVGHIAYYIKALNALFSGDTIFSLGCGKLFEGSPEQMWNSIQRILQLPDNTLIYCSHEYTLANAKFAIEVEPNNLDLQNYIIQCQKLRAKNLPTIPCYLANEKKCNPFLRIKLLNNLRQKKGLQSDVETFAYLRKWKDNF